MRSARAFVSAVFVFLITVSLCRAEVNLLAMGDWGSDKPAQKQVASALADYVSKSGKHFDGMLLAGDNFYTNLSSTSDPMWQTMFEQMYDRQVLNFPFYASLGNHDYQNGKASIERAYAREHPESRWKMPARYYRVEIPEKDPLVTILMLDSNRQVMSDADWNAETFWLKTELEKPRRTKWLICCCHHPLFSNGNHGDNGVLQHTWGELFMQNHVDLFVAGHDHDIQHLEIPNMLTSLILVGGGGQNLRPMRVDVRGPFSKSSYGFGAINLTKDAMTVRLVSKDGQVLHEFRRTPDRRVETIMTTPSDPATPRTIGSITRDNEATTRKAKKAASGD